MFDTVDTVHDCIRISTGVISTVKIFPDKMLAGLSPDMLATDLAEYLVRKGAGTATAASLQQQSLHYHYRNCQARTAAPVQACHSGKRTTYRGRQSRWRRTRDAHCSTSPWRTLPPSTRCLPTTSPTVPTPHHHHPTPAFLVHATAVSLQRQRRPASGYMSPCGGFDAFRALLHCRASIGSVCRTCCLVSNYLWRVRLQCGTTTCRQRSVTRRAAPPLAPCWSRRRSCAPTWRRLNERCLAFDVVGSRPRTFATGRERIDISLGFYWLGVTDSGWESRRVNRCSYGPIYSGLCHVLAYSCCWRQNERRHIIHSFHLSSLPLCTTLCALPTTGLSGTVTLRERSRISNVPLL